jgi:hypothetical protein
MYIHSTHLESTITFRRSTIPKEHTASRGISIGRSGKVSIVLAGRILNGKIDRVVALASFAEVIRLEVVRSFGETVLIRQIMNLRQEDPS